MKFKFLCLAISIFFSLTASCFYSLPVDEYNKISELNSRIVAILPQNSVLKEIVPIKLMDGNIGAIFVRYTLNGSAIKGPEAEALGLLTTSSNNELCFSPLLEAEADSLSLEDDNDGCFFDSANQKIFFAAKYVKYDTKSNRILQESEVSILDGRINHTTNVILDSSDSEITINSYQAAAGKIISYTVLKDGTQYFYVRNVENTFVQVSTFPPLSTKFMINLICNQVKYFYKLDFDDDYLASLYWLNSATSLFEGTNFEKESCSLFIPENDHSVIVDPKNPLHILGYLVWEKGRLKPKWMNKQSEQEFSIAEEALREKLHVHNPSLSEAEFDYQMISVTDNNTIRGWIEAVGFQGTMHYSYSKEFGVLCEYNFNLNAAEKINYSHKFLRTSSKIKGEQDTDVYYSLFKNAGGSTDESKKTLVYIMGGPWCHFCANSFLDRYQDLIDEGYTIIVPHEPLRDGFGYQYLFAKKQLGCSNLFHIMNILDHAAATEGVNSDMVLMGESYGGWVASALAAAWEDFKPESSKIKLSGCVAQVADLNFREWKNRVSEFSDIAAETFADNPIDVASITKLQAPLFIFQGIGDDRCSIESIKCWAEELEKSKQPFSFFIAEQGHLSILQGSLFYSPEEKLLRLNILKKFFQENSVPAVPIEKLNEIGFSVLHDNLGLVDSSDE